MYDITIWYNKNFESRHEDELFEISSKHNRKGVRNPISQNSISKEDPDISFRFKESCDAMGFIDEAKDLEYVTTTAITKLKK